MVRELLPLLPQMPAEWQGHSTPLVVGLAGVGAMLLLLGAKFSRSLCTLAFVAGGALLGLWVPKLTGWVFNEMVLAVAGALVGGILGYLLHRLWIALALGVMLAGWAAMAVWVSSDKAAQWVWPAGQAEGKLPAWMESQYWIDLWQSVPDEVKRAMPAACGIAAVSGVAIGLLWHRTATILLHSLVGTTLIVGMFLGWCVWGGHKDWLERIPDNHWVQLAIPCAMALFGCMIQMMLMPRRKNVDRSSDGTEEKKTGQDKPKLPDES